MEKTDRTRTLVEALIEGVASEPPWAAFLHRLRAALRADYASIIFRPVPPVPGRSGIVHLASGNQSPPPVAQLYRDALYAEDPLPYRALEEGRVYRLSDLLEDENPAHASYRARLLAPSGMNFLLLMRFAEPGGHSAWLSVTRRTQKFSRADENRLAGLAPYLRASLAVLVRLERARAAASLADEAVGRMNFSLLTLDAEGRIVDCDARGEALLKDSGILVRGKEGRLTAPEPGLDREVAEAVRTVVNDSTRRPRALVLSREPWLDMLLVPAGASDATLRASPSLIAYVHADRWSSEDRCEQLCHLFDLLPSEARLALALSRGLSIAQAAAALGLTVETGRTYSKRIYAKTGARGRADLVRFIHRSVLALT